MANVGNNSNGSQFFITTVKCPHLDGRNVVFGRVLAGKPLIRQIESVPTNDLDCPKSRVVISQSGELTRDEPLPAGQEDDGTGDIYCDNAEDEPSIDLNSPSTVFDVVENLKEIGTKLFMSGQLAAALAKYRKATDLLMGYFPDDIDDEDMGILVDLKVSLHLNLALLALKNDKPFEAVGAMNEIMENEGLTDKERAKALYRRGSGYLALKDEQRAIQDLNESLSLVPGDGAILQCLQKAKNLENDRKKKEKLAFSKFFS